MMDYNYKSTLVDEIFIKKEDFIKMLNEQLRINIKNDDRIDSISASLGKALVKIRIETAQGSQGVGKLSGVDNTLLGTMHESIRSKTDLGPDELGLIDI
jgi:hypothetical protein